MMMNNPRDVKLNELEKVINQYQEKLNDVTQSYQQKIGILENKIIDKELETGYSVYVVSLSYLSFLYAQLPFWISNTALFLIIHFYTLRHKSNELLFCILRQKHILSHTFLSRNHVNGGDEDDYSSSPTRTSDSADFSDFSPDRNPRSHLTSAKSIDVIREESFEDEDEDVLLELGGKR